MSGAIAAGHPVTAEAGAAVLAEGGNAVDACVTAAFVSWVAESTLTGPGGGGFMLVHRARDRRTRLLDFFVSVPSGSRAEAEEVSLVYDAETTQLCRIGTATCGVPGTIRGLETAHRAYGTLPWRELLERAAEVARGGVALTAQQAYLHTMLDAILRRSGAGRAIYGEVAPLEAAERLVMRDLAHTLELLGREGADAFYGGDVARALVAAVPQITAADLSSYRVVWRRPLACELAGDEFLTNPPPSSGGVLIAYALRRLAQTGIERPQGSAAAVAQLARVMEEQAQLRARRARLDRRVLHELGGTTHISVVDADGNAASLSASNGVGGSGVVVPGTGIHVNNMLGELDLVGRDPRPGARLTSMMAPSIALRDGRVRLVLGSAGSNRLRSAILQVVVNTLGYGMGVAEAVARPRVHLEGEDLHVEPGVDAEGLPYRVVRWADQNLFFGGASAVERRADGTLAAAGDPRRGGHGIVVA